MTLKKKLVIAASAAAFIVILLAAAGAYMKHRFDAETAVMNPVPSGHINPDIYAVRDGFVNVYLVKDGESFIAFDAGNDCAGIAKKLSLLKLDPQKVEAVFLTHTDRDHVAALGLFPRAKVYISGAEKQMVDGTTVRSFGFHNHIPAGYATFDDGETVVVGSVSVRAILAPGHTPGSTCYLVGGRYLFTGDTLSLRGGKAQRFNDFFNMDSAREEESIRMLARTVSPHMILTAHYGVTYDADTAFAPWK